MHANRHTLTNALRAAANRFDDDAKQFPPPHSLRDQFFRQAEEVRKLADKIEEADSITLED